MDRELAVRALSLYIPITLAGALWVWRLSPVRSGSQHTQRVGTAVLLASTWNAVALFILNLIAIEAGWWAFHVTSGAFAGIPLDLYIGWIVLWSAVPVLAFPSVPIPFAALVMMLVDVVVMPMSTPVVTLGAWWFVGEFAAVAAALTPALYLARWTMENSHLQWRATLQMVAFSGLMLLVIPTAVLEQSGGNWAPLVDRSSRLNGLLAQLLAIPAIVGLSAVQEFVVRGGGTPLPYDPPHRLVTTGPYAFVANPMQLGLAGVFVVWAFMLQNPWMIGASVMTVAYGSGLAAWHEERELVVRFGDRWTAYRREVRFWCPRWRPFTSGPRARLYVAHRCSTCRGIGQWLVTQGLVGLDIVPAESHPSGALVRLTYQPPYGGPVDEGVAAFARALEHIHFGWAWVGMLMRLPIIRPFLQVVADASGAYPRAASPAGRDSANSERLSLGPATRAVNCCVANEKTQYAANQ